MAELMDIDIVHFPFLTGFRRFRKTCRIKIEDPASAVSVIIHKNCNKVVRCCIRDIANCPVLFRQHVSGRAECVIRRTKRRMFPYLLVGHVNAGIVRDDLHRTNVEIFFMFFERLIRKKLSGKMFRIFPKFLYVLFCITVTKNEDVHLFLDRSVYHDIKHCKFTFPFLTVYYG